MKSSKNWDLEGDSFVQVEECFVQCILLITLTPLSHHASQIRCLTQPLCEHHSKTSYFQLLIYNSYFCLFSVCVGCTFTLECTHVCISMRFTKCLVQHLLKELLLIQPCLRYCITSDAQCSVLLFFERRGVLINSMAFYGVRHWFGVVWCLVRWQFPRTSVPRTLLPQDISSLGHWFPRTLVTQDINSLGTNVLGSQCPKCPSWTIC